MLCSSAPKLLGPPSTPAEASQKPQARCLSLWKVAPANGTVARSTESRMGMSSAGAVRELLRHDVAYVRSPSTMKRVGKWLVAAFLSSTILWTHDPQALWAATGSVVNLWLSVTLKKMLNHRRPMAASRSDPGMPSTHAQSIFFSATYATLTSFQWVGPTHLTMMIGITVLACGCYLSWSRVSQQLHSIDQVLVGVILGSGTSMAWFWLWHTHVLRSFATSQNVQIALFLGLVAFFVEISRFLFRIRPLKKP